MNVQPPQGLDFANARTAWSEWIVRFNRYRSLSGLDEKSKKKQVDTLVYVMGEEAERIYKQITIAPEPTGETNDDTLYDRTVAAFETYFNPQSTSIHHRIMFNKRVQKPGETNENLIRELHSLSLKCGWDENHRKSQMTTQLLAGMTDKTLSQELQLANELDLDVVTNRMRTKEVVQENQRLELDGLTGAEANINAVRSNASARGPYTGGRGNRGGRGRGKSYSKRMITDCKYCTYTHEYGRCPAYGKKCNLCSEMNHFRKACQSNKQVNTNTSCDNNTRLDSHSRVRNRSFDSNDELFLDTVCNVSTENSTKWILPFLFKVSDKILNVKIDTGAEVNVIPVEVVKTLGIRKLQRTKQRLVGYSGDLIPLLGRVDLELEYRGRIAVGRFYVRDALVGNGSAESLALIGLPTLRDLDIISDNSIHNISSQHIHTDNDWLRKYPSVFNGLGKIGTPISLKLKDNACPRAVPNRHIPLAERVELKNELDRLVKTGVIVKDDDPCEWSSPIVRVRKPDGSLRICLDPQNLNECLIRNRCEIPTTTEIFARIHEAKYFTKLDAVKGFHQVPIDLQSSKLTSFVTPFGKFRYLRMPMGIKTAPEIFHSIVSNLFMNIPGVYTYIDDILVVGSTMEEHNGRLQQVLDKCVSSGLTLSPEKSVVAKSKLTFLGHELSSEGIRPAHDKLEAMKNMTCPQDKKEAQKFLGFVTYLAKFIPDLAGLTEPIRNVCKKFVTFYWNKPQQESFDKVKAAIMSSPTLGIYDPQKPLVLSVDASSVSLGACLMQEGKPIEFASKSLTSSQRNYAQIEKELLAVYFGCSRFHLFTYARNNVVVETDHKPLVGLMKKDINALSPRLASLRLKLMPYSNCELKWSPGKQLIVADMLSRSCPEGCNASDDLKVVNSVYVDNVHFVGNASEMYRKATDNDEELFALKQLIMEGWPSVRKLVPVRALPYWTVREMLTVDDGLVYYGNRLVVPQVKRNEVVEKLHKAHQGVTKTMLTARRCVYWPGMVRHIQDKCLSCKSCCEAGQRNKKEPMIGIPVPEHPFEVVGSDIFYFKGCEYLILVDYFSKFPLVYELSNTRTGTVIDRLKLVFSEYGIPRKIISDNGPQYTSFEFAEFCKRLGVEHRTSSPMHQQANGQAERLVDVVKSTMSKCSRGDLWLALLSLRNTPIDSGLPSPAQLLQGRNMRTQLVVPSVKYTVEGYDNVKIRKELESRKSKQKLYYDAHASSDKDGLLVDQQVRFRTAIGSWVLGRIVEHLGERSYVIEAEQGGRFRRNRVDIRMSGEPIPPIEHVSHRVGSRNVEVGKTSQSLIDSAPLQNTGAQVDIPGPVPAPDPGSRRTTLGLGSGETRTRSGRITRKPNRFGYN